MSKRLDTMITSTGSFEICLAEPKDSEIIRQMLINAALWMNSIGVPQWNPDQFTEEEVASYFATRELYLLFSGDEPVGFFTLQDRDPDYWGSLHVEGYSYLHRLTVNSNFRGQGLGNEMIHWAVKRSRELNRLGLRLDCWAKNEKVNLMYQALGFKFLGIGQNKYGRQVNLYELDKKLFESL
ncbi:ribosomal protein S18 acetylase RimI-like enzyme [Paenibacillus anaericanus]|uniref:GNAT family N-acetyltransferase n=1 Tax=Paenibacillus anaericanus TaxID=170367 RepID=A0A433YDW9_9BACL|nr:GNAT family N-acetyltransferase [Paenibacillus anaericanus]MDQ0087710.1 ribosomal protein S18 acetylase RimI-like enzyme [Paenibacillus anaericanus]RUT48070.1 GNAT family N-acetyltransferase [Paenibacillus anaericanus]